MTYTVVNTLLYCHLLCCFVLIVCPPYLSVLETKRTQTVGKSQCSFRPLVICRTFVFVQMSVVVFSARVSCKVTGTNVCAFQNDFFFMFVLQGLIQLLLLFLFLFIYILFCLMVGSGFDLWSVFGLMLEKSYEIGHAHGSDVQNVCSVHWHGSPSTTFFSVYRGLF